MADRGHTGGVPTVPLPERSVGCDLAFEVGPAGVTLVLQVAAAGIHQVRDEHLDLTLDGAPVPAVVTELVAPDQTRTHVVGVGPGVLSVSYRAAVRPPVDVEVRRGPVDAIDPDALTYLRQSRYAPSDQLRGFAVRELGHLPADALRPAAVASWVFERLGYFGGSSGPLDSAIDTLLTGSGVCRDFAHLTVALCRALEIPARLVAVYAPGLSPMDFHAVAEVRVDGRWEVVDATRLAPRSALVRIATGRDAADTAFATTLHGEAELTRAEVQAVIEGDLPLDDHDTAMRLA